MKILFYNHTGQVSGAERVLLLVLARLNRGYFRPEVICPAAGQLKKGVDQLGVPCHEVDGLEARFTGRIDHLVRYLRSFCRLAGQVRTQVIRLTPDLIHANSVRAGLVSTAATIGLDIPVVWHVHDMLPRHPLSTAIRLVVLCSRRTRIVAISKAVAERFHGTILRATKASTCSIILNAVESDRFHPDPKSRQRERKELNFDDADQVIGIVGQLTPRKGQLELLEAFALVLQELPRATLVVVGAPLFNQDEEYLRRLEQTVETFGIGERVRFLGARHDIAPIMRALDLLVVNSLVEPFGLVVLEGMACGTPVLATAVDGIPEIITHGENGWLVPPRNANALASAMVQLLSQPGLRASLSARALEKVSSQFTAERYMRELQAFYEQSQRFVLCSWNFGLCALNSGQAFKSSRSSCEPRKTKHKTQRTDYKEQSTKIY